MALIKVKSDEKLFDRIRDLSYKIQNLGGIVQNDMELEAAEVVRITETDWNTAIKELWDTRTAVLRHIIQCNEEIA